ncbi:carotenoid isomerooxygenase-like [Homarus americanus]|uniref:Carotenoid isomerooxygenase-like 2 n=1 Tax=Homarus americanus TaxID=6706 RepID=A0A8J5JQX8_HOMAM|nr:carotenoid isomerooxygenase-like [Homarus americanus]KAG7157614.1 Carotenoid isomerooxygenase-like 2 [Homarus americanus]
MPYDFTTWDRNCLEEHVTPIDGTMSGSIPPWLRGSYILDGPGRMTFGEYEFNHVFDGSALLQKFTFGETGVTFASRFLRTYAYNTNLEHEQIVVSEFGTTGKSVAKSKLSKLGDRFAFDKMFSDNAPIGVVTFGGEYYCITEAPFLHKIDPTTLETISKVDLHKELGINSHCPNPRTLADGTTLNILHGVGATGPKYDIMAFPPKPLDGKAHVFAKPKKIASVDARWKLNPCHMHTFGLTENYFVLLEQPLTIDVKAMVANTIRDKPFIGGMEWMEDKLVKIHLINRETGKEVKQKVKCEAFFYMHIINCHERDNHVVIDVNAYKKPDLLHAFHVKNLREKGGNLGNELDGGNVKRIVIPMEVSEKVAPELNLVMLPGTKAKAHRQKDGSLILTPDVITDYAQEVPTLHPDYVTKRYRYFYGSSGNMTGTTGKVSKVDMETREIKEWCEDDLYTSVSYFVPRPGATTEDDGVLLVTILHGKDRKKITLLVLNSADMSEAARVVFITSSDVPRSLHGNFIPA